jgi:hypothetical protein
MSVVKTLQKNVVRLKYALALGFLFLLASQREGYAQKFPHEFWHEGKIVLDKGDTLRGVIKYDLQADLLQFNNGSGNIEAYSSKRAIFFEIFDSSVKRYRQFYSLPFTNTSGYKSLMFFEFLTEGKITLLAKEALEYRTENAGGYYRMTYTRLVLVNKYYFMDEKGNIEAFEGDRNALLKRMGNRGQDVNKYIKTNRLKYDYKYDFVKIIEYYNSFFSS